MPTEYPELFAALASAFSNEEVKTRTQGGRSLHYITARTAMNRLDSVLGPENWWDDYEPGSSGVLCRLSIRLPDGRVLTKADAGGFARMEVKGKGGELVPDDENNEKSGFSDAFKRACAKFCVGRYLYRDGVPTFDRAPTAAPPAAAPTAWTRGALAGYIDGSEAEVDWTADKLFDWIEKVARENHLGPDDLRGRIRASCIADGFPERSSDWTHDHCEIARMKVLLAIRKILREAKKADAPRGAPSGPESSTSKSYGQRLIGWIESLDPKFVDRDLMRTKLELWAEEHGHSTRIANWDKATAKSGFEYLNSGIMAGMFTPDTAPVGNIHDADPDNGGEVEDGPEVVQSGQEARKPKLDRMPEPPKPGRVRAWAKDLEQKSGVAIAVPWKQQAWAVYQDEVKADRALDDYNDRERDLFYRFALWCLGFEPAAPGAGPAAPADPAELRSAILDMADRLIKVQSEVGRGPDDEPVRVVDRKTLQNLLLFTYRDAYRRVHHAEGPDVIDVARCQDWPALEKMREILRLRLAELEAELARAKEDRAQARRKGGRKSA